MGHPSTTKNCLIPKVNNAEVKKLCASFWVYWWREVDFGGGKGSDTLYI